MFSIVQQISPIGQHGDLGLYFGPNSRQSPGDIVSFDFFSMENSKSKTIDARSGPPRDLDEDDIESVDDEKDRSGFIRKDCAGS